MAVSSAVITFNPSAEEFNAMKITVEGNGGLIITVPLDFENLASSATTYLNTNHSDLLTAEFVGDVMTIAAVNEGVTFSGIYGYLSPSTAVLDTMTVEYNNVTPVAAFYTGLESDRYLINNPIIVGLNSNEPITYYSVFFENLTNQQTSTTHYIYADAANAAKINIAPIVKTLFDEPQFSQDYIASGQVIRNANLFRITITANEVSTVIEKTFIRGGKRTNDTNQNLLSLATLRPSALLPVWTGYDTADYVLNADNQIIKKLLLEVSVINIDYRRSKGCNELYVVFHNQMGGYSSWLFDTNDQSHSAQSLGTYIRNNKVADMGTTANFTLKAIGKIPVAYKSYIDDLIDSPEIYAFIDGKYVRVTAGRNSITEDPSKRSYNVSLNFDFNFRYNPSLLWSN